jgi:hypothetical protein
MATHDYVIANGTGAAVRSDLNNALAAIVSNNSSSSEPGTTYAYQWWADTNANVLKLRNSSNDGWITLRELDGTMLIEDGSASTPGLAFADDVNTGIFSPAADQIGFATGGAERLEIGSSEVVFNDPSNDVDFRVESNGQTHMLFVDAGNDRFGIRTSSPDAALAVNGGTDNTIGTFTSTDAGAYISFNDPTGQGIIGQSGADLQISVDPGASVANSSIVFQTDGNAEKARIDSSGRLLVGTSSARSNVLDGDGGNTLTPQFQFETANSDTAKALSVIFGRNNTNGAEIVLGKHRSASVGGTTVVSDGDQLGSLTYSGSDGTNFIPAATIEANVDGTPGTNDMPGRLVFSTTADGASSPTERMRIDNNGITYINTTSNPGSARLSIGENFTSRNGLSIKNTGAQGGGQYYALFYNNAESLAGSISHNGSTSVAFNTSSDYRLKENITSVVDGITRLQQLKPSRFNFIADPNKTVDGFIAHEVQTVIPEAITGDKDAVDDEGNPIYQGIDQSKLVPLLTAALQEAIAKIETLEAKVAALEAG